MTWVDLSVQYFGAWTPQKVKDRVTEVLYGWTLWLKEEPKIKEAYCMLKKQGLDASHQHLLVLEPVFHSENSYSNTSNKIDIAKEI